MNGNLKTVSPVRPSLSPFTLTECFMEAVWKDEQGERITCAPHQLEWHRFIREQRGNGRKRIGILAPFKHGKTPHILGITLAGLSADPEKRIKIVCNDDNNAMKRVTVLKRYIEQDEDYGALFADRIKPDKSARWNAHAITVKRKSQSVEGSIESAGVLSTGIGGTYDQMIFDDPCDLNNSTLSAVKRDHLKELARNVWLSRLDRDGEVLYIATAWHAEDLTHELIDNPEWTWLIQRIANDFSSIEQVEIRGDIRIGKGNINDHNTG